MKNFSCNHFFLLALLFTATSTFLYAATESTHSNPEITIKNDGSSGIKILSQNNICFSYIQKSILPTYGSHLFFDENATKRIKDFFTTHQTEKDTAETLRTIQQVRALMKCAKEIFEDQKVGRFQWNLHFPIAAENVYVDIAITKNSDDKTVINIVIYGLAPTIPVFIFNFLKSLFILDTFLQQHQGKLIGGAVVITGLLTSGFIWDQRRRDLANPEDDFFLNFFINYYDKNNLLKPSKPLQAHIPLVELIGRYNRNTKMRQGGLSHEQAERVHDWVQYAFPTKTKSQFNVHAPTSTAITRAAFRSKLPLKNFSNDPYILGAALRDALMQSAIFFFNFMGLEVDFSQYTNRTPFYLRLVDPTKLHSYFIHKHNFLRTARVIESLGIHGCHQAAQIFYDYLINLGWELRDFPTKTDEEWNAINFGLCDGNLSAATAKIYWEESHREWDNKSRDIFANKMAALKSEYPRP